MQNKHNHIMKIRKKILLTALAAASLCMSGTAARALSITIPDYEIGAAVNSSGHEMGLVNSISAPGGMYQFGNPQGTVDSPSLAPVSGTLHAPEGDHRGGDDGPSGGAGV